MAISMNNHVFKGHRTLLGNKYVTYGELEFPTRYDIYQKSKTGFDWGNNSHGANQLAFSMLFQLTNKELALKYVDKFTKDITTKNFEQSIEEAIKGAESFCYETNFDHFPLHWAKIFKKNHYEINLIFFLRI